MHHIGKIARHDGQHEGKEKALHQTASKVVPHLLLIGLSRGTDDQLAECEGSIARFHHISVEPADIRAREAEYLVPGRSENFHGEHESQIGSASRWGRGCRTW